MLSPVEAALAGLLHDIGKLAQRAHPNEEALRRDYGADLAGTEVSILPLRDGRYTHRHALWSDWFFRWSEREHLRWPAEIDAGRIKGSAVRHHAPQPDNAADWIITEADCLAAGLERKERGEDQELNQGFRKTELLALLARLDIGLGQPKRRDDVHAAEALSAEGIMPRPPSPSDQPRRMGDLWDQWKGGFAEIARHPLSAERFEQAVLALSERLLWAVPSSTIHQPDVSLHEHARAVAAIAAALAGWHACQVNWEVKAIKDRNIPKFRLIALDLSGIQDALFRLAGHQGAARILRARSFLMAETVSAALLGLRARLGLPAACVMLNAGGKAELLAPALPGLDECLEAARAELDPWMVAEWQGDLALLLAAGPAFPAKALMERGKGLPTVRAELAAALEAAKQRPFAGWTSHSGLAGTGVIETAFGADGSCASCGARPALLASPLDGQKRCRICDATHRLGQRLPKMDGFALAGNADASAHDDAITALPPPWRLLPWVARGPEAESSFVFPETGAEIGSAVPRLHAYVPTISDPDAPRYRHLGLNADGEEKAEKGDLMTFGHIAAEALEENGAGGFVGRALLGIVKADVDRLGQIFGRGLSDDKSPARIAQLSRLIDAYFARRLPWLLRQEFPATYTVYAGGDDLLLITPWRFAMPLALRLRADFSDFSAGNPNLTLSAGIAFVHAKHPLALAVKEAEEALEDAKKMGRNRLGVLGRTLCWDRVRVTLSLADDLYNAIRNGTLPSTFLHRMRNFAADRARAEGGDAGRAGWNAKWRYHRERFLERANAQKRADLAALLDRCLPGPGQPANTDAEIAMTVALWRNR